LPGPETGNLGRGADGNGGPTRMAIWRRSRPSIEALSIRSKNPTFGRRTSSLHCEGQVSIANRRFAEDHPPNAASRTIGRRCRLGLTDDFHYAVPFGPGDSESTVVRGRSHHFQLSRRPKHRGRSNSFGRAPSRRRRRRPGPGRNVPPYAAPIGGIPTAYLEMSSGPLSPGIRFVMCSDV